MSGEATTTLVGNLTADPEVRFTQSGKAVCDFTVAVTPRVFRDGEWADGDTLFMRCSLWGVPGENAAESLYRGDRVIVTGRIKQRSFETKEGEKRTVVELDAEEVGPSLRYATAKITKPLKNGTGQRDDRQPARSGGQQRGGAQQRREPTPQRSPWDDAPPARGGGYTDEPPF